MKSLRESTPQVEEKEACESTNLNSTTGREREKQLLLTHLFSSLVKELCEKAEGKLTSLTLCSREVSSNYSPILIKSFLSFFPSLLFHEASYFRFSVGQRPWERHSPPFSSRLSQRPTTEREKEKRNKNMLMRDA